MLCRDMKSGVLSSDYPRGYPCKKDAPEDKDPCIEELLVLMPVVFVGLCV